MCSFCLSISVPDCWVEHLAGNLSSTWQIRVLLRLKTENRWENEVGSNRLSYNNMLFHCEYNPDFESPL